MPTLTKRLIAATPPAPKLIELRDDKLRGFHVRIWPGGAKTYHLYYRNHAHVERRAKLGRCDEFSPDRAREIARDMLERVRRGEDPAAERKAARLPQETYQQAVEDYITREQIGRRGNVTASEVKRTLLREGSTWNRLRDITAGDVRALVEGMRDGVKIGVKPRPYLANRMFAYLRTFFAWCAEPGIDKLDISPMIGLKRPWEGEEARERVFTDDELRALWRAAEALSVDETLRTGQSAGAYLRVMLLVGKRRGALAAMRWDEIGDNGLWAPLTRRRRNKHRHPVPLPKLALRIIDELPRKNPYVFAGRIKGGHLDPGTPLMDAIRKASGVEDFFFHACRHTLETRLASLRVPPHLRDLLLDHVPVRGSGKGYDHHEYEEEMREALEKWAARLLDLVG